MNYAEIPEELDYLIRQALIEEPIEEENYEQ